MIVPIMIGGGLLLVLGSGKSRRSAHGDNSQREDQPSDLLLPVDPMYDPYVLDSLDWLYSWGGPALPVAGLKRGSRLKNLKGDCGGLLWVLQIEAGVWPENFPRLTTQDYPGDRFKSVPDSEIRPGDVLLYPRHVAVAVGGRGLTSTVWSNSGGNSKTYGDNPNARPKLFKGPKYRADYIGAVRLK